MANTRIYRNNILKKQNNLSQNEQQQSPKIGKMDETVALSSNFSSAGVLDNPIWGFTDKNKSAFYK